MPRKQQLPGHLLAASLVVMTLWLWKMLHDTSFLVNAAMAFGAMARSVEGAMLLTDRLTDRLDER